MGRFEAPTLDSLGPDAGSFRRQPRQFLLELCLGQVVLGLSAWAAVAAVRGGVPVLVSVVVVAAVILGIWRVRPSVFGPVPRAAFAVLSTAWFFVIVPQWREGRERLRSLADVQNLIARGIQALVLLGLAAIVAHHAWRYAHAAAPEAPLAAAVQPSPAKVAKAQPLRAGVTLWRAGSSMLGAAVPRPADGCETLSYEVRSRTGYWIDEVVFEPQGDRCLPSVRASSPPSAVRGAVGWIVEEPAEHAGVWFQLSGLLVKGALALGAAVASLMAVPVAIVRALAGSMQVALGIGEALLLLWAWHRTPSAHVLPRDEASQARLILCQLSDVHLSLADRSPVELAMGEATWPEPTLPDGAALMGRLTALLRAADALRPELIAITGDLTDTGASEEWDNAEAAVRDAALQSPLLLIPGNHDLCFNPIESPDFDRSRTAARRALFVERAARMERGSWALENGRAWRQVFPRLHTTQGGVHLFAFDTNGYGSRQTLSNAVGLFGRHALARLERELARRSGPVVVMAHHHVVRPLERAFGKDPFLIAIDARALLDILCRYNAEDPARNGALVVHGHRHLDSLTRYENHRGRVDIYSHPSSTLGYERDGHLDGVPRFASVWLDAEGRWAIKSHAVEPAADGAQADSGTLATHS